MAGSASTWGTPSPGPLGWSRLLGNGVPRIDRDRDAQLKVGPLPLLFLEVLEPKTTKNRVHLDLQVQNYEGSIARAIFLGATPADDVHRGANWQVLRDPEGNEFCIVRPKSTD